MVMSVGGGESEEGGGRKEGGKRKEGGARKERKGRRGEEGRREKEEKEGANKDGACSSQAAHVVTLHLKPPLPKSET